MAELPDLHELWINQNRPSPEKFRLALQRRGIRATAKDLKQLFYKYQSSKHIFAPPPKYKGKIFSPGLDRRWAADVMVLPGPSYALVVQDIFSRFAWAEHISSPMEANQGMEVILHKAGRGRHPTRSVPMRTLGFRRRPSTSCCPKGAYITPSARAETTLPQSTGSSPH